MACSNSRRQYTIPSAVLASSSNNKDDSALKVPSFETRHDDNLTKQVMEARTQIMQVKLKDAAERKEVLEKLIQTILRLLRQMCVLTPIQEKTREDESIN